MRHEIGHICSHVCQSGRRLAFVMQVLLSTHCWRNPFVAFFDKNLLIVICRWILMLQPELHMDSCG